MSLTLLRPAPLPLEDRHTVTASLPSAQTGNQSYRVSLTVDHDEGVEVRVESVGDPRNLFTVLTSVAASRADLEAAREGLAWALARLERADLATVAPGFERSGPPRS